MPSKKALEGLKVADFTWNIVGPLATKYLAEHGATVIKIESQDRPCVTRTSPPYADNTPGINRSGWFTEWNTNKYSITLNLKHPRAMEIIRKLIGWADIVGENFAPGVFTRLGLGYELFRQIKPDIIMFSASMQGQTGPHSPHPGFGMQLSALSGFTELTGWPDRGPVEFYGPYTDFIGARFLAVAVLAAVDYRRRTGKGQYLDLSQYECAVQYLSPLLLDCSINGHVQTRLGNQSIHYSPHGVYRCQGEDRWCAIAVTDAKWPDFCRLINGKELINDPRFATLLMRIKNREELDKRVESWTMNMSAETVMSMLQKEGIAAGVVQNGEDVHNDPQFAHREHFTLLNHAEMGKHTNSRVAFRLSKTPGYLDRPAPCLGQDNEYVFTSILGYSTEEFVELLAEGVLE